MSGKDKVWAPKQTATWFLGLPVGKRQRVVWALAIAFAAGVFAGGILF